MASQIEEQMRVLMARREQMKREEETKPAPSDQDIEDAELIEIEEDQAEIVDEQDDQDEPEAQDAPQVTGEDEKDLVMIYHAKCLRCQHLTSTGTRIFNACHFSNGNTDCPAKSIRIVIGINFERAASLISQAMLSGDTVKLKSLMEKLESRDEIVRKRVMTLASQMLAGQTKSGQ
jgi:hypothetical protein